MRQFIWLRVCTTQPPVAFSEQTFLIWAWVSHVHIHHWIKQTTQFVPDSDAYEKKVQFAARECLSLISWG